MAFAIFLTTAICYVFAGNNDNTQMDAMRTRAVVFMHGVTENAENGNELLHWIQRDFPGIRTHALTSFQDSKSLVPLETQVEVLQMEIYQWLSLQPDKIRRLALIGHSQGALIGRFLVEYMNEKGIIHTLISIGGPQAGQYGAGSVSQTVEAAINIILGVEKTQYFLKQMDGTTGLIDKFCADEMSLSLVLKNLLGPKLVLDNLSQMISCCTYWKNPLKWRERIHLRPFFNRMNNERSYNATLRDNFLMLQKLVLVGTTADETINPWQSAFFGFYAEDGKSVRPMEDTELYQRDKFGLRSLNDRGAIKECVVNSVNHTMLVHDEPLYKQCIRPYIGFLINGQDFDGAKWPRKMYGTNSEASQHDMSYSRIASASQKFKTTILALASLVQIMAILLVIVIKIRSRLLSSLRKRVN